MILKTSYPFMKPPPSARLIRGHRLGQGLAGLWPFGENGGLQVFDLSGNGNTGNITGATWCPGKSGSALKFDGDDDKVSMGNVDILDVAQSDFTMIINLKTTDVSDQQMIISKGQYNVNNDWYWQLFGSDLNFYSRTVAGSRDTFTFANPITANKFYTVVCRKIGTAVDFFVDGISVANDASATHEATLGNSKDFKIGQYEVDSLAWNDVICYVYIYNRALSASEIAELYVKPFCMFEKKARTALLIPSAVEGEATFQVSANTDDAMYRITTAFFDITSVTAGAFSEELYQYGGGVRFQNVTIPQGATITEAYLRFCSDADRSGTTINTRISAEDVDSAATFSTEADFNTRRTNQTVQVDWDDIGEWVTDSYYNSPEIKTVIQAITDRVGWNSGQDMVIFWDDWDDRSTHTNCRRAVKSHEDAPDDAAELHVTWTTAPPTEAAPTSVLSGSLVGCLGGPI